LREAMGVGLAIAYQPTTETSHSKVPEGLRGRRVILWLGVVSIHTPSLYGPLSNSKG
jgi:hypothetical protein